MSCGDDLRAPRRFATHLLLLALLTCSSCAQPAEKPGPDAGSRPALASSTEALVGLGAGFVVWESSRTGRWRLWMRDLEGGPPRQLTPDEGRRLHCCPHISPNGEWIAFLSLPPDQKNYPSGGAMGSLQLIRPDGSELRTAVPQARTYWENRAVVWRTPSELIYIEPDRYTALLDLDSGTSTRLTRQPPEGSGWLINSRLAWAASGDGSLSTYDSERKLITGRTPVRGCQPYFSHDGRWGFWVVAPGGPLNRLRLDSGDVSTWLKKSDARLPPDLGYLYFPMLSRDGRLLAFAASDDHHHHFEADYEIFVVETDPDTLELTGLPVRITHHPATDRFPDVFLEPLPLGRHYGEAPFRWRFEPQDRSQEWKWIYGDGGESTGPVADHTFEQPGRYEVRAVADNLELRGQLVVAEARPPQLLSTTLLGNGREIALVFDEPVETAGLSASLESGSKILGQRLDRDGRRLRLELATGLQRSDRLHLQGLTDRAQRPNTLPPVDLSIEPASWPSNRQGLAFLWETADAPNLLYDPGLGADTSVTLTPRGTARLDPYFALVPGGGYFTPAGDSGARIIRDCQSTYELSLEMVIGADTESSGRVGMVLTTASKSRRIFSLEQRGTRLVFGIRMKNRGEGAYPKVSLFELPRDRKSHVVITYSPGRLVAYLDGQPMVTDESIEGGFFPWREAPLILGADWNGRVPWRGTLEGLAIYNRALEQEEVRENFLRYRSKLEARPALDRWQAVARRESCSAAPTLDEIAPYREALMVCEYQVREVLEGAQLPERLRVAQWIIQDGQPLSSASASSLPVERLSLTRFQDNPQLESVYLSDTLVPRSGEVLMYRDGS